MQVRHTITLAEEISKELESVCKELGEKKSHLIEKALTVYLDFTDLKLAEKRLEDLETGKDTIVDADTVWKEIGVE